MRCTCTENLFTKQHFISHLCLCISYDGLYTKCLGSIRAYVLFTFSPCLWSVHGWICKRVRINFLWFCSCLILNQRSLVSPPPQLYNQLMFSDMILPGWWCTHQLLQCFCWGGNLHSNVIAHVWKSLLYKCIQHVQLANVALLSVPSGGLSWFLHPTPPTISACVCLPYMEWLQLRGAWLAIGQIVLPVGRFSVHS